MTTWLKLLVAAVLATLAGCGSGGSSGGTLTTPPPVATISAGGLWFGKESVTGRDVIGIVSEGGEFHFLRSDGVQFFGSGTVAGTTFNGSVTAVTASGTTFPDGSTGGSGNFSTTLTERVRLQGTVSITTGTGRTESSSFALDYDPVHTLESSLGLLAGNYQRFDRPTATLNINSAGVMFGQDPVSGCVLNGQASLLDSRFSVYRMTWTYSSCGGASAVLNGVPITALAAYDNSDTPPGIAVFGNGRSGGNVLALTLLFNKT